MTFYNSNIIAFFRKEGEIASLIIGFITFVISLVITCSLTINSPSNSMDKDKSSTMIIVGIAAIIVIFVLAVCTCQK